ncbi:MAG TPA: hypothetical protein DIU00_17570 [Phycisphaerales bacterium]|nr:hypothetical protein [Phycisphaerales bacterium]
MKQVYVAQDPSDDHILVGILDEYGISCEVHGESLWAARGELPLTMDTQPTVWILEDDKFDQARNLVLQYENKTLASNISGGPWKRPNCGEEIEAKYTDCWQCGMARPEEMEN